MSEPTSSGPSRLTGFAVGASLIAAAGLALHFLTPDPEEPAAPALDSSAPPPGPAPDVRGPWRVVVLPFAAAASEPPDTGDALAHALAAQLDRGEEVTATRGAAPDHDGPATWSDGVAACARADATHFVLGALEPTANGLRARAALHHRRGAVVREGDVTAARDAIAGELGALAATLLGPRAPEGGTLASTTRSLDALRAFVRGERAAAAGEDAEAEAAYGEAIAADPRFTVALYRRADALERLGRLEAAIESLDRALRDRDALAPTDIMRAEALRAVWRGQHGRATALLTDLTAARPDDVEAWLRLGEVQLALGPSTGRPPEDAAAAFDAVLERRAHDRRAIEGALVLAAERGDLDAMGALVERLEGDDRPPYAAALAVARGEEVAEGVTPAAPVLRALPGLAGHAWLASRGEGPDAAVAFAEHALAHGRPEAALARLAPHWDALSPFEVERMAALLAMPPFAVPTEDLAPICARATASVDETPEPDDPHAAARPLVRRFLAGACAIRERRTADASAAVTSLRAEVEDPVAAMLAATLEAWLALDGQPARVEELLSGAPPDLPAWQLARSPILSGAIGRWILAEARLRRSELAAALPVAQSLAHPAGASRALAAQAAWLVAEVYRRADREVEMRAAYARFLAYREGCEPPFEGARDQARRHAPPPEDAD